MTTTAFSSDAVFAEITEKLVKNPELADKVKAVYVFCIKKGDKTKSWTTDLKSKKVYEGEAKDGVKVDCTITLDDDDFVLLSQGKANSQQMFMKGKLKIKGNVMVAQKLGTLFKENSKL